MSGGEPPPTAIHVGILALSFHLPPYFVRQEELERAHGVPAGKYTKGLGQASLGFGPAGEDACSRALSAAESLLDRHGVPARAVGRVDVGTETSPDRSKSVASVVVGWLARRARAEAEAEEAGAEEAGTAAGGSFGRGDNGGCGGRRGDGKRGGDDDRRRPTTSPPHRMIVPVEAVDHTHACYGGAAALFAAAAWVESSAWDGRSLALVVATDGAAYPPRSPARATGGGGAAAMLVGPGATLVLEGWPHRASAAAHAFDFYKPHARTQGRARGRAATTAEGNGGGGGKDEGGGDDGGKDEGGGGDSEDPSCPRSSHYPVVDGAATTDWFLLAADAAGRRWHEQGREEDRRRRQGLERPRRHERREEAEEEEAAVRDGRGPPPPPLPPPPPGDGAPGPSISRLPAPTPLLDACAAFVCHSPFTRMVRKALGRLAVQDAIAWARWRVDEDAAGPQPQPPAGGGGTPTPPPLPPPPPLLLRPGALAALTPEARRVLRDAVAAGAGLAPSSFWALGPLGEEERAGAAAAAAAQDGSAAARALPPPAPPPPPTSPPPPPPAKALDAALGVALEASGELERLADGGTYAQARVGNAYTASIFLGLASTLARTPAFSGAAAAADSAAAAADSSAADGGGGGPSRSDRRAPPPAASAGGPSPGNNNSILAFAFGSGVCATLFRLRPAAFGSGGRAGAALALPGLPRSVAALAAGCGLERALAARLVLSPRDFDAAAAADEAAGGAAPYEPPSLRAPGAGRREGGGGGGVGGAEEGATGGGGAAAAGHLGGSVLDLPAGAWYLARVDARYRRVYARRGGRGTRVEDDETLEGSVI